MLYSNYNIIVHCYPSLQPFLITKAMKALICMNKLPLCVLLWDVFCTPQDTQTCNNQSNFAMANQISF